LPHACYMIYPSHPLWLDHSNYTWRTIQVMKLLIMQFSPTSFYFTPLRSKYSPQHPVLKYPHSMFSRYGGQLRIYWISSRRQPTWDDTPAWGLGVLQTTPHSKNNFLTIIEELLQLTKIVRFLFDALEHAVAW
jgi:hypothetical protein